MRPSVASSSSSRPSRLASCSLATLGSGREPDAVAREARADRERDRQVSLPGPGRAKSHDRLLGVQEVELPEMLDHRLLHAALEGEVELLQRLSGGEPHLAMRASPPWLSRADTSVCRSVCTNCS